MYKTLDTVPIVSGTLNSPGASSIHFQLISEDTISYTRRLFDIEMSTNLRHHSGLPKLEMTMSITWPSGCGLELLTCSLARNIMQLQPTMSLLQQFVLRFLLVLIPLMLEMTRSFSITILSIHMHLYHPKSRLRHLHHARIDYRNLHFPWSISISVAARPPILDPTNIMALAIYVR